MKKTAAILLAMILLLCAHSLAFTGSGYPAWDGAELPDNSLGASFGGERLLLEFDPTAGYSEIKGGTIQACFFAYDAAQQHYLEMYIVLPENIAAGDSISGANPGKGANVSLVSLFEVHEDSETAYFSYLVENAVLPKDSSFEITIEKAERTPQSLILSGRLRASLCRYEGDLPTGEFLEISDANFCFTLPLEESRSEQPIIPGVTPVPPIPPVSAPAFTLPPDYISL